MHEYWVAATRALRHRYRTFISKNHVATVTRMAMLFDSQYVITQMISVPACDIPPPRGSSCSVLYSWLSIRLIRFTDQFGHVTFQLDTVNTVQHTVSHSDVSDVWRNGTLSRAQNATTGVCPTRCQCVSCNVVQNTHSWPIWMKNSRMKTNFERTIDIML